MSDTPWKGKLHHARRPCDDWGCIRDEADRMIIRVNLPTHDESVLSEHRRNKTDPAQERVDAILAAVNQASELASVTAKRDAARDDAVKMRGALQMANETAKCLQEQLAAMTARAELAERQVARLISALENAAARLHTANTVGAFESVAELEDYLAEGYQHAHEALAEAAKGVAK